MPRKQGYIKTTKNKYILSFKGDYKGTFDTYEEAEAERLSLIETYEPVRIERYIPVFAERLNIAIGNKNKSVRDICRRAGLNPSSISHYLNGNTPSVRALIKLSVALDVSIDWLLGLDKEEKK